MSINFNFNFGGMNAMGGMNPMMGGMNPMMGMGQMNPMMMMMQMMQMLMGLMMGMGGGAGGFPAGQFPNFGNNGGGMPGMGGMGGCGCAPGGGFLGGGNYGGGYDNGGGYGNPSVGGTPYTGPASEAGQRSVEIARQFLGQRSIDVRGRMGPFSAAGGLTNNCADFVSSALVASGRLSRKNVNCRSLERQLQQEGWRQIPADQARPGDVIFNQSRGHVQLSQGGGRQIGSNNSRPGGGRSPGLQFITEGPAMRNAVVYTK